MAKTRESSLICGLWTRIAAAHHKDGHKIEKKSAMTRPWEGELYDFDTRFAGQMLFANLLVTKMDF